MADLPPPYSPRSGTAVISERAASPPPPSYEVATGQSQATQPPATTASLLPVATTSIPRPSPKPVIQRRSHSPSEGPSSLPSIASSSRSSAVAASSSSRRTSLLSVFRNSRSPPPNHLTDEEQILASIFRTIPWRNTWGPAPSTLDTALQVAALNAHEGLVRALLDNGAPINYTDRNDAFRRANGSAVHMALRSGIPQLSQVIIHAFWQRAFEAELNTRISPSKNGLSVAERVQDPNDQEAADAAAFAMVTADEKVVSLLDGRDKDDCTPLHMAASVGETDEVRILLRRGAELDARDKYRRTPLHMAARYKHKETVQYLIGQGASTKQLLEPTLWGRVIGKERDNLGSYDMIRQFIQELLAEDRKRPVEKDEDEEQQQQQKKQVEEEENGNSKGKGKGRVGEESPAVAEASSSSLTSSNPYRVASSLLDPGPDRPHRFANVTSTPQQNTPKP